MYLQLLNYVSLFFILIFLICFLYAVNWDKIAYMWQLAKTKVLLKKLDQKIASAEQKGETRFEFNNGKTVVYGLDYKDAYNKYKTLQRESRYVSNQLKKEQ